MAGVEMDGEADSEETAGAVTLSAERCEELQRQEEFVLTVSDRGYGKRTSSYEYRIANRGGQGIWNMEMSERNGAIVASFPITDAHQIMMVTNGGQVIRMPVHDVRVAGRKTQGVTLFRVGADERVVSIAMLKDEADGEGVPGEGVPGEGVSGDGAAGGDDGMPDAPDAQDAGGTP
jgi:DNA gyrase subunit A